MHLYQEYANRMNIKKNFIRYADFSILYLKSDYKIFSIEKIFENAGPLKFKISKIDPINKHKNKYSEVEWDEYENYIKNLNLTNVVTDACEVYVFSWEIFLALNDDYISKNISHKTLYSTIDEKLDLQHRKNNINLIEDFIQSDHEILYNIWRKNKIQIESYSYWLVDIIKENYEAGKNK